MTTTLAVAPGVDPEIIDHVLLGIATVSRQVDLSDLVIHLSTGNVATAQTEILPDGSLDMVFSVAYERAVTDPNQPHPNTPDATADHEILHRWFNPENPAFEAYVSQVRIGGTNTFDLYFNGPEAVAVNGGPLPIDQFGHILGGHQGDIMSGEWPTYRDRPQELSNVDLAILRDVGALAPVSDATSNHLAALYAATLGRAADAGGLAYWQHQLDAGMPLAAIASSFFAQPEAQALYANNPTEALVEAVYHNTLGRSPDSAGEAYWSNALATGAVDPGQFVLAIINGAQGTDAAHLQPAVDEYVISTVGIVS